jgi:hypothetical protein
MRVLSEELVPRLKSVELVGEPRIEQSNLASGLKFLPDRVEKEQEALPQIAGV